VPNLNDLNLLDEDSQEVAEGDLPPQGGGGLQPLPRPGTHKFQLPGDLTSIWETVDSDKGQRVAAVFADENALSVLGLGGQTFRSRISTVERPRGKEKKLASDMSYLLRALEDQSAPRKSSEFIKALNAHAGEEFRADVEWGAFCNPAKDIFVSGSGRAEGKKGCGQRYGMRDYDRKDGTKVVQIPRHDDGTWAEEFDCGTPGCGATIRCFGQLTNFRAIK